MSNVVARLAIGNDNGDLIFYGNDGKIIAVDAYPHYDGGDGDYGYQIYQVARAGNSIVLGDEDWEMFPVVDARTLNLAGTWDRSQPSTPFSFAWAAYVSSAVGVGDETWLFVDEAEVNPPYDELHYVIRLDSTGQDIGHIPISGLNTNVNLAFVDSWDKETFYLCEGQARPKIWRWSPGSDAVLLGSIWSAMQGGGPSFDGEARSIAMHGPDELIAVSYNSENSGLYNNGYAMHAHLVHFSLPDLTVIHDYQLMDMACAGTLDTFMPRFQPTPTQPAREMLLFGCASDGTHLWTGDWLTGSEIWRIDPTTHEVVLWNKEVWGQDADFNSVPVDPHAPGVLWGRGGGPLALNVRDFNGYQVPLSSNQAYQEWPVPTPPNLDGHPVGNNAYFTRGRV